MSNSKHTPLRWGMIGGGAGSNIGDSHRMAARLDNRFSLTAGVFDVNPEKGRAFGSALNVPQERIYADHTRMLQREAMRTDGIQIVSVATPNATHYQIARDCLTAGLHVICEKPVTTDIQDAFKLKELADQKGLLFVVMHNYAAYPLVRQAALMVKNGVLGKIRVVQTEFSHGFLSVAMEKELPGQAWRQDPDISGRSAVIADVGTHAFHLAEFITGQKVGQVSASLDRFVEGRVLEDNAQVTLKFDRGAKGALWASSVAAGNAHGLRIRVFGEEGSLEWEQENSATLHHRPLNAAPRQLIAGKDYLEPNVARLSRVGAGHDSGYIQAFANVYRDAADLLASGPGGQWDFETYPIATAQDGIRGLAFIDAALASHDKGSAWVHLQTSKMPEPKDTHETPPLIKS